MANEKELFERWLKRREEAKVSHRKRMIEISLYVTKAKAAGIRVAKEEVEAIYKQKYGK
jgi:hypothetical protein